MLWFEVHSGDSWKSYESIIAHCIVCLIDQFRYLRCLNQEIKDICGFVFPKRVTRVLIACYSNHAEVAQIPVSNNLQILETR